MDVMFWFVVLGDKEIYIKDFVLLDFEYYEFC